MKRSIQKQLVLVLCIFALGMFSAGNSFAAATWYTVKITQIVPRSNTGDVFVQFVPGTGETRFTGTAKGILLGSDTGTNKVMAVLLTAVTLNAEITILLNSVPVLNPAQVIVSTGLVAP